MRHHDYPAEQNGEACAFWMRGWRVEADIHPSFPGCADLPSVTAGSSQLVVLAVLCTLATVAAGAWP
jgi:hypothetical protein